jgi:uncharacterized protein YuzE
MNGININFGNQCSYGNYGNYGNYGGYRPCPRPVYGRVHDTHGNLDGVHVRSSGPRGFLGAIVGNDNRHSARGYGIDLNQNGRYDRGQDGILAFDYNKDGKVTNKEINRSREMMRALSGTNDVNGDGKVGCFEKLKAKGLRKQSRRMGIRQNRDGSINKYSLSRAGGRVLIDSNRDGKFTGCESRGHSPFALPTRGFGPSQLDFVNPRCGYSGTSGTGFLGYAHPPCYYGR